MSAPRSAIPTSLPSCATKSCAPSRSTCRSTTRRSASAWSAAPRFPPWRSTSRFRSTRARRRPEGRFRASPMSAMFRSWSGLSRPFAFSLAPGRVQDVDARRKGRHDESWIGVLFMRPTSPQLRSAGTTESFHENRTPQIDPPPEKAKRIVLKDKYDRVDNEATPIQSRMLSKSLIFGAHQTR
ncbi:hypothetical protein BOSEA31B_12862 [Hyphomicrobiales bacterium]|nr:hypothetical protein BOSEA31B_12862 [Hyphomicrobiales bacterium]CAH1698636.1 hypothetical protein BOSEA1005_11689 [Hyphomicrobiales bacterium]CAI0342281.1 hypothetical protein BO1005MUT1_180060 [Hyphomicrobiales bacterium]